MTERARYRRVATPVGEMILTARADALTGAYFADHHAQAQRVLRPVFDGAVESVGDALLARAAAALDRYFEGDTLEPGIALAPTGTPFQRAVWSAIAAVGCGQTASYGRIAEAIGAPQSVRAVGAATGRNPLCIFIPCHRIVGSDGRLTGYAGGLERKRTLLELEGAPVPAS